MRMVDHVRIIDRANPLVEIDDQICVMDREIQFRDVSYQVFAYINHDGKLEVNLSASTAGTFFAELNGADAVDALRAALQGNVGRLRRWAER